MKDTQIDALKGDEVEIDRERLHHKILSSVSHDLKTPLAAVIGSLEIYERLHHKLPAEKSAALITTALQEAYRLDNFITNILDIAKLENNMVKIRPDFCDMQALLEDCVEKSGYRFQGGKLKLVPLVAPMTVHTDPALLCRVINLLLDNAIKYGGASPMIQIQAWQEEDSAIITISDRGPGIPEDKLELIFSKYTRLNNRDHQNASTGLGLAIGREIIKLLGGSLKAANHSEGGAVFTLRLDLKPSTKKEG